VQFRGTEDRLNPIAPQGVEESTLGGYPAVHGRAPGFEASDGMAYTAAIETEAEGGADGTWAAYLVFLRWAEGGTAIMGHLETDDLTHGATADEARAALEAFPLARVKEILEESIARRRELEES
jgi:hypothetical protein